MLAHRGKPTSAESPFNLSPAINSTPKKPRCRDIFAGSALLLQLQEQAVGVGQQQPASHQAEGDGGATEGATRDPHLEERLEVHHQQLLLGTCFVVVAEQRLRIVTAIGGEEFRRDPLLGPEMESRLTHSDYGVCEPSANDAHCALCRTHAGA